MRRLLLLPLAVAVVGLVAFGCSKSTSPAGYGTVRVALTDAPADYDSIVLHIREVAVHRDSPDSTAGWFTVATPDSNFDLLVLQNGVFANLGSVTVPAGHYTQVRLILGPGSYIVVNGQPIPTNVKTKYTDCLDTPNYTIFSNTTSAAQWNADLDSGARPVVPLETAMACRTPT